MEMNALTQRKPARQTALALLALLLVAGFLLASAHDWAYAKDSGDSDVQGVRAAIQALSADPTAFKESDSANVEAINAAFEKLKKADRDALDKETSHSGTGQPLGRVLESALWAVKSYESIDDSTTLPPGTYDSNTKIALSSEYSKGKSTSSRQKPWSVKSVKVDANGKAKATIAV